MENSIGVVFCSKKKSEENKGFIEHIKDTCGCDTHVYSIHNPDGVSLSKVYADMMESKDIDANIIVFIHDDIEFLRKGWGKEILRLFNEHEDYGIIVPLRCKSLMTYERFQRTDKDKTQYAPVYGRAPEWRRGKTAAQGGTDGSQQQRPAQL